MRLIDKKIYEYVKRYNEKHGGLGPSYGHLMKKFGVTRGVLQWSLKKLKNQKFLTWEKYGHRSLRVLK